MPTSKAFEKSVHVDSIDLIEGFARSLGIRCRKKILFHCILVLLSTIVLVSSVLTIVPKCVCLLTYLPTTYLPTY